MLLEASSDCAFGFAHIRARAGDGIRAGTGYVVDEAHRFTFLQLVFGLYQGFPD